MKRFVLIITAIITLSCWGLLIGQVHGHESVNGEGIQFFDGTWDEALALAKKENKLIFLDIYNKLPECCKYTRE